MLQSLSFIINKVLVLSEKTNIPFRKFKFHCIFIYHFQETKVKSPVHFHAYPTIS